MHRSNKLWLKYLKKKYPKSFTNAKVLELGSGDTSRELAVRSYFKSCEYVGVDRVGKEHGVYGVDVVKEAGLTDFKNDYFDTLLCFSMFEHDPKWKSSLMHNLKYLKSGAMIFICFGAEGNRRHDPEPWAIVKHADFLNFCFTLPIKVIDAFFEEERYGYDCAGAFDLIAQKKRKLVKNLTKIIVKPVPQKSKMQILKDNFLYHAVRFKRNLQNIIHIKQKYFYSQ
jgi:SAM-dependent methyltransferase